MKFNNICLLMALLLFLGCSSPKEILNDNNPVIVENNVATEAEQMFEIEVRPQGPEMVSEEEYHAYFRKIRETHELIFRLSEEESKSGSLLLFYDIKNTGNEAAFGVKVSMTCYDNEGNLAIVSSGDSYKGLYFIMEENRIEYIKPGEYASVNAGYVLDFWMAPKKFYDAKMAGESLRGRDWSSVEAPITLNCKFTAEDEKSNKADYDFVFRLIG